MASFASALLVLYYGMHLTPGEALVASLWVAAAATLTEAISTHGTDNLTLQLVASAVAWWLGKA
jgi:dolichol kinase